MAKEAIEPAVESELRAYGVLADTPRLIALNKIDIPEGRDLADIVRADVAERGWPVFEVSAVSHEGLRALTFAMADAVRAARAERAAGAPDRSRIVLRPTAVDDGGFEVRVLANGAFRVLGARPTRWVRQTDFSNDEAVAYLGERLARLGVEDELRRLGAVPGCDVLIGSVSNSVVFDWQPSDVAADEPDEEW